MGGSGGSKENWVTDTIIFKLECKINLKISKQSNMQLLKLTVLEKNPLIFSFMPCVLSSSYFDKISLHIIPYTNVSIGTSIY